MNSTNQILGSLLGSNQLAYAAAIGTVAVLVLLLLRRRPDMRLMAFYLAGGVLAIAAAPLMQAGLTAIDQGIGGEYSFEPFPTQFVLRTLIPGALAATLGVLFMARAWRDSPER